MSKNLLAAYHIIERELKELEQCIFDTMAKASSTEYSREILDFEDETSGKSLMEDIVQNVLETSPHWLDAHEWYENDVQLAIGRELKARLERT